MSSPPPSLPPGQSFEQDASGSPGRAASGSTSGLTSDGQSDDFDTTAGGTVEGLDLTNDVEGTPNTDRAADASARDAAGASSPETPGF